MGLDITPGKYLSEEEYKEVYGYCYKNRHRRNALMFLFLMCTGCRVGEMVDLTQASFFLEDGEACVQIKANKGSADRTLPIPIWLYDGIKELPEKPFNICVRRVRYYWTDYRPVPKKLHSLRHTFAIRLYQQTKDVRLVQYSLGHKDIKHTLTYVSYIGRQSALRNALAQSTDIV